MSIKLTGTKMVSSMNITAKAVRVINSCQTPEQLNLASRYAVLACKTAITDVHKQTIQDTLSRAIIKHWGVDPTQFIQNIMKAA